MEHIHADVTENSYFIPGRSECFFGDSVIEDAKDWLIREIESDDRDDSMETDAMGSEINEWDGISEAVEVTRETPGNRPGYSVVMGYRLMRIDGACERTI